MKTHDQLYHEAYMQGYQAGYDGRKIDAADWEEAFQKPYLQGELDGKADKANAVADKFRGRP